MTEARGFDSRSPALAEGWALPPLLDVLDYDGGGQPPKKDFIYKPERGYIRLLQIRDFGEKPFPTYVPDSPRLKKANADDLLLARYGGDSADDSLGRICSGLAGAYNVALVKLVFSKDVLDAGFVRSFFLGPWFKAAIAVNSRSCQKGFNRDDLRRIAFPIPPLAEQRRIVAKVEELLARVNAARERLARVPALLKRFRQSVLAAACSGQLTADWRTRRSDVESGASVVAEVRREHAVDQAKRGRSRRGANAARNEGDDADGLDLSLMPGLPEAWQYVRADEIVEPGTVVTYGIVLPGPQVESGVPYVRGLDIENGHVLVDQLWKTTRAIAEKHDRSRLEPGDVLLCIIRHLKVAIVPEPLRGGNLTQGTVRMRPSRAILGKYLARYLESSFAQEWMKSRYFGMDMPRINVEDTRAIPVPVPSVEEQEEIVRRVELLLRVVEKIEARVQLAISRVEMTTQAVLAKAFRGELVPTEAELARLEGRDYEPASALLERIRAERAVAGDPPRRRATTGVRAGRKPKATASSAADNAATVAVLSATNGHTDARLAQLGHPLPAPAMLIASAINGMSTRLIGSTERDDVMAVIRETFSSGGARTRLEATKEISAALGYSRAGSRIAEALDNDIRAAVRRGILENNGDGLRLLCRSITDYDRNFLIDQLQAGMGTTWWDRDDLIESTARWLGFRRTGPVIRDTLKSAISIALRRGFLESDRARVRRHR